MSSLVSRAKAWLSDKENLLTSLLLVGTFGALGARSISQQQEIDALESTKESLRASNRRMQSSMWEWRESLFDLHQRQPSAISLPTLLRIFGDQKPVPDSPTDQQSPVYYAVPPLPYAAAGEAKGPVTASEEETTNPTSRIAV